MSPEKLKEVMHSIHEVKAALGPEDVDTLPLETLLQCVVSSAEDLHKEIGRQERTIARLREERTRLQDEVVQLRGDEPCSWFERKAPWGKRRVWSCPTCGRRTNAPVRAYYDPCPGRWVGSEVWAQATEPTTP